MALQLAAYGLTEQEIAERGLRVLTYGGTTVAVETKYVGRVLSTYERNFAGDSDFYAAVINEDFSIEHIEYASTRGWSYCNYAEIDASIELRRQAYEALLPATLKRAVELAGMNRQPKVGSTVRVVKGRKVPLGFTDTVKIILRERHYTMLCLSTGVATYIENVEVIDPIDVAAVEETAKDILANILRLERESTFDMDAFILNITEAQSHGSSS